MDIIYIVMGARRDPAYRLDDIEGKGTRHASGQRLFAVYNESINFLGSWPSIFFYFSSSTLLLSSQR